MAAVEMELRSALNSPEWCEPCFISLLPGDPLHDTSITLAASGGVKKSCLRLLKHSQNPSPPFDKQTSGDVHTVHSSVHCAVALEALSMIISPSKLLYLKTGPTRWHCFALSCFTEYSAMLLVLLLIRKAVLVLASRMRGQASG